MREIASFVVRVYRRDPMGLSGVVEDVQTGCVHSFHSAYDLWLVLDAPPLVHSKEENDENASAAPARARGRRRRRGL